jgi:hypothetical protein
LAFALGRRFAKALAVMLKSLYPPQGVIQTPSFQQKNPNSATHIVPHIVGVRVREG